MWMKQANTNSTPITRTWIETKFENGFNIHFSRNYGADLIELSWLCYPCKRVNWGQAKVVYRIFNRFWLLYSLYSYSIHSYHKGAPSLSLPISNGWLQFFSELHIAWLNANVTTSFVGKILKASYLKKRIVGYIFLETEQKIVL